MSRVEASIEIAAPPRKVWDYVMDPRSMREWVSIVRSIGHVDDGGPREGFEMQQTLALRGVSFKVDWRLVEHDPPRFARWEGRGPARSTAVVQYRLSESGDGTRFDYANEFRAPFGPLGSVASRALVGGMPRKEASASLERLKGIVEDRRPASASA